RKVAPIMVIIWIVLALAAGAAASSLFAPSSGSLFSDYKARQVGDLVTVLIIEQARATQSADTASANDNVLNLGPGGGALADLIPLLRFSHSSQLDGSGTVSRGGSMTAKITTKVVELYDNGTMKIEGGQKIKVNGEEQEIVISGIIRTRDIGPDNTILSSLVADAEIQFTGSGIVADKQERGLITRFFDWLF
ncbi:MAG TPA: flagellar basal body L-ring protein FlgH, partial [Limnochordia bacterium]|nr:flagellar basal body L-ring protein FlgH [Limnochordia bacterium]